MPGKQRSWEKRLAAKPDELTVNYVESLSYDRRLYKYDIVGSIAHAGMLAERKLITAAEFKAIKNGLIEISEEIDAGRFRFDRASEDIHMAIEAALIKKIGQPGEKLHTARSRNDQVATDIRLYNEEAVMLGRRHGDLVERLGRHLGQGKETFLRRHGSMGPAALQILHEAYVQVLAAGNAEIMPASALD